MPLGEERFRVDIRPAVDCTVLELHGELDLLSAHQLDAEIDAANEAAKAMLVLDIRDLQFIDSVGLRVILSANERAKREARGFAVTPAKAQVQRVFDVAGASKLLRTIDSPDELPA